MNVNFDNLLKIKNLRKNQKSKINIDSLRPAKEATVISLLLGVAALSAVVAYIFFGVANNKAYKKKIKEFYVLKKRNDNYES